MYRRQKNRKLSGITTIFDLNENIFREIFLYLDHHIWYSRIRKVCRTFKSLVDNYVQLGGIFVCLCSFQTLFVYKKHGKVVEIETKYIKLPTSNIDYIINNTGFCAVLNGKFFVVKYMKSKEGLWVDCPHAKQNRQNGETSKRHPIFLLQGLWEYTPCLLYTSDAADE